MDNRLGTAPIPVAALGVDQRVQFIRRTYGHLAAAIAAFVAIEAVSFSLGIGQKVSEALLSTGAGWLLVLGGFILVGTMASRTAARSTSLNAQRGALAAYVVLEALIFMPLLWLAHLQSQALGGGSVIAPAGLITLLGFAALTGVAVTSKKDFSFLGGILKWAGIVALLAIVAAVLFG
ncbi:MAG: Bax inhibitor-1/YccA family protein, partial [Actinomycetota bacterium]